MIKKIKTFLKIEKTETRTTDIFSKIDYLYNSLETNEINIEIGSDIVPFIETIRYCIDKFRTKIKNEYGFIFSAIRIRDNSNLQENELKIFIQNKLVIQSFFIPTKEKIKKEFNENLNSLFYKHVDEIFTCEIMERYINLVRNKNSYLIWNLTNTYSIVELKDILVALLKNKKSIKNISYIMEQIGQISLSNGCPYYKNPQKIINELLTIL